MQIPRQRQRARVCHSTGSGSAGIFYFAEEEDPSTICLKCRADGLPALFLYVVAGKLGCVQAVRDGCFAETFPHDRGRPAGIRLQRFWNGLSSRLLGLLINKLVEKAEQEGCAPGGNSIGGPVIPWMARISPVISLHTILAGSISPADEPKRLLALRVHVFAA